MGVKKIARPINEAKNQFLQWLKDHNAESVDEYVGDDDNDLWDYYCYVSGFVGSMGYTVIFMVWAGKATIDYSDEDNRYRDLSIDEFLNLIKC